MRSASVHSRLAARVLLAGLVAALATGCGERRAERPNFLLVVVDTLRADGLGVYGNEHATSPRLDALASEGTVFTNSFSVGATTSVAMSAIMTGRLPYFAAGEPPCSSGRSCPERWTEKTWFGQQRFYREDERGLARSLPTLAELLAEAGYSTAGFITNPFLKVGFGFNRGFSQYQEIFREEYPIYGSCAQVTGAGLAYLRSGPQAPFFLYLHYMEPHAPYLAPEQYQDSRISHSDYGGADRLFQPYSPDLGDDNGQREKLLPMLRALYDAEVRHVDDCIGAVLNYLAETGLKETTVIAVTADHGEEFLERGKTGHTGRFFDEHIRVPLLVRDPKGRSRVVDSMVRNFDLMPTLLDYAGVEIPGGLDAISLKRLVEGKADGRSRPVFSTMPFVWLRRLYRNERFKLIEEVERPERSQLYDLEVDPGEALNIIGAVDPSVLKDLRSRLDAIVRKLETEAQLSAEARAQSERSLDRETRDQIRALGYLD